MANSSIEIAIYKDTAPFDAFGIIEARQKPTVLREIKAGGAGSFLVSKSDQKILDDPSLLDYRNFVRVRVNGKVTGGFILTNKEHTIVGEGEKRDEMWELSGEGLRSWGKDATVRPANGVSTNSRETRYFNFATEQGPWYNAAQWTAAVPSWRWNVAGNWWGTAPSEWPDAPTAWWIWSYNPWPGNIMTMGTVYFRKEFTLAESGSYALFFAADDYAEVYVDGELIHTTAELHSWQETAREDFELDAGPHVIAFKAKQNVLNSVGGIIASFWKIGNAASPTAAQLMFVSDNTWKVCGYPATEPGWSVGNILLKLLDEAKTRGVRFAANWTPTFSGTHDSAGNAWGDPLSISFDIGSNYEDVFEALEESACDIFLDPDTLELHAWKSRGVDRSLDGVAGGTFQETRRNLVPVPQPTVYAGSGWAAAAGTVTTPGWISATITTNTTGYFFTDGADVPIAAGDVVTLSATYRIDAMGTSAATHVRAAPHIRTGNTYIVPTLAEMQAQNVLRPITLGKVERVVFTWTADRNIAAGDLDLAIVTAISTGGFGTVGGGFQWSATRVVIERGGTDGSFFDGSQPDTSEREYVWLGPDNNSISVERSLLGVEPIVLRIGHNLKTADEKGQADIVNTLLLKTADGWEVVQPTNTDSVTKYGVLEGQISTEMSKVQAAGLVGEVFEKKALPEKTATFELIPVPGMVPFENFFEGDYVSAPGEVPGVMEKRRVMSISITENKVGDPIYAIEFDAIFGDRTDDLSKLLSRASHSSGLTSSFPGASGTPSTVTQGSNPRLPVASSPQAPEGLAVTSQGRWADNGMAVSDYSLTWNGVIANVDDLPVTDIESYEVWGRRVPETEYARITTVFDTFASIPGNTPGEDWYFQIRAQSRTGGFGPFSEPQHLIAAAPIVPLPAPSAPTLESDMGVVAIKWDGLLGGSAAPSRYKYMEVQRATAQAGPYAPVATLVSSSGVDPTGTVGTQYWYRLVPVDFLGVKGAPSTAAPVTVTGVALGNLDESIQEAIDAANEAAQAAQQTAGAAQTAASDAQAAAEAAETAAANALSSIDGMFTWSTAAPVVGDGAGKPMDAIWYRTSSNNIIGQWRWNGTAWVASPIDDAAIVSVNAAKLTAGILDAARIGAGSISTSKLLVSNLDNQIENSGFEYDASGWTLSTGSTVATTNPRTGTKALTVLTSSAARLAATSLTAIAVEPGEQYRLSAWVRLLSGAVANTGIILRVAYGLLPGSTATISEDVAITEDTTTTTYVRQTGVWTVPEGAKFARVQIYTRDAVTGKTYYVDDVSMYQMAAGELIVDGAITAVKIGADEINADHIQAGSIAAEAIQAGAVTAEKVAADAITANHIAAGAIEADNIAAGAIQVSHLSPSVGNSIDISANESVNIIVGRQDDLESGLDDTNQTVDNLTTYYSFGPDGAVIGQQDSAFKLILKNDRVEIVENGVVVSYWDSGRMVVPSFVGNEVVLGNHKLEKYGTGTVVRAI